MTAVRVLLASMLLWAAACLGAQAGAPERPPAGDSPGWLDRVQVYSFIAVPEATARRFHVTVNGVWNGWGTESPVASLHPALIPDRLRSDRGIVKRTHDRGMRHVSTLPCVFSHRQAFEAQPALERAVCRTATRGLFAWRGWGWYMGDPRWMCQNSPLWQHALIDRARRAVDAGTDAIVLDEAFGDTFASSLPLPGVPGFSDLDLGLLARDLAESHDPAERMRLFDLRGTDVKTLRERLSRVDVGPWVTRVGGPTAPTAGDRLWARYSELQRRRNHEAKRELIEAIRAHSRKARGAPLPVGANLAELDAASVGARPLPVLYLAHLLDFVAFEMAYRPPLVERGTEGKERFLLAPRAKWTPWHQLGVALFGPHRAIAYPSQNLVDRVLQKERRTNYICQLFAEAYANRAALILNLDEGLQAERLARYAGFVREHADLFEYLTPVAPIGILYASRGGLEGRTFTYLGLAQALYESGQAFSVVPYLPEQERFGTLDPAVLERHALIVAPQGAALDAPARATLAEYVARGGTLLLLDEAQAFDLPAEDGAYLRGKGRFVVWGSGCGGRPGHPGDLYYEHYDDTCRQQIADLVAAHAADAPPLGIEPVDRLWTVLGYAQPSARRAVLHLVNSDYEADNDRFRPKRDLTVKLRAEAYGLPVAGAYRCTGLSPDRDARVDVPCSRPGEDAPLEVRLPALDLYEVVTVEATE